jgi:ubiquinone/menaquinone biosynthesis C-methylase UbiE
MKKVNVIQVVLVLSLALLIFSLALHAKNDNEKPHRDSYQKPDKVLKVIGVKPGMVIGEPGAGKGYFTLKLARKVGPTGKIYANDIAQKDLDILKSKVKKQGLTNVVIIKGKETNPLFPKRQLDMVFMSYVLHDLSKPVPFLENLKSSLKVNAPLVILERDPEKYDKTAWHFWKKGKILKTVRAAGYRLDRIETFLPRDNIYIFYAQMEEHLRK